MPLRISHLPTPRKKKGGIVKHIDEPRGTAIIELNKRKKEESLGITISGGTDKGCPPFISNIRQGGIADQCDYFCVGEDIISINDTDVRDSSHAEIIQLVQDAGKTLVIEIQYKLPTQAKELCKTTTLHLQTDEKGLGFSVKGKWDLSVRSWTFETYLVLEGDWNVWSWAWGESKDAVIKRPITVTEIEPETAASRSGLLMPGDEIVKVNGKPLSGLHISQVSDILSFVQNEYTLDVQYYTSPVEPHVFPDGSLAVDIVKPTDDADPGITFDVSLDFEEHGSIIMISEIQPGSMADRVGCLCVGDLILSVNGVNFEGLCLEDAVQILLDATKVLEIKLYPSSLMHRKETTLEPLIGLFDFHRQEHSKFFNGKVTNSSSLSPSLKALNTPDTPVMKSRFVTQPVVMDRNGTNRKDSLSSSIKMESSTAVKQTEKPKERCVGSPKPQPRGLQSPRGCRDSPFLARKMTSTLPSQGNGRAKTSETAAIVAQDSISLGRATLNSFKALSLSPIMKYIPLNCATSVTSVGSLLSHSSVLEKLFSKSDTLKVRLEHPENDFGMQVEDILLVGVPNKIIIANLEQKKCAHSTGVIMVGDRVVSVNGIRTDFITSIDVERLLQETNGHADVEINFSISDTLVPTSGSFSIKLEKSCIGTGIVLGAPSPNDPERYPRIVEIKKGSTAHRSGVLCSGDQILNIDDTDVCSMPVADAHKLLDNGFEVVKLMVKKDEEVQGTTFTVELERKGQQLGITISGSENPFEPILITGISEDGLAYKSKAVLVGDRLLAINGVCLRGKSLTKAYDLLHDSENTIKLLIKREAKEEKTEGNASGEPQVWTWIGQDPVHVCVQDSSTISVIHEKNPPQKDSDADSIESYCDATDSSRSSESYKESRSNIVNGREGSVLAEEVMDCIRRSGRASKSSARGKANTLPRLHGSSSKTKQSGSNLNGFHRSSESTANKYDTTQQTAASGAFKRSKSFQGNGSNTGSSRRLLRKNSSPRHAPSFPTVSEDKASMYYGSKQRLNLQNQGSFDWSRALGDSSHVNDYVNYQGFATKDLIKDFKDELPGKQNGHYKDDSRGSQSPKLNRSPFHSPRPSRAKLRRPDLLSFSTFAKPVDDEYNDPSSSPPSPMEPESDPRFPFFPVTLEQVVLQRASQSTQTATCTGFYGSSESISSALVRRKTSWREATESYKVELKHSVPNVSIDYVSLRRQNSNEDFGFSVSEKVNGSGIYVRSVQPKSLAAESGKIRRYDRILQVNGIHTRDIKCDQLVPFLQRAGRKLDIVIERRTPPYI